MKHAFSIILETPDASARSVKEECLFLQEPAKRILSDISEHDPALYTNALAAEVRFIGHLSCVSAERLLRVHATPLPSASQLRAAGPIDLHNEAVFERPRSLYDVEVWKWGSSRDKQADFLEVKRGALVFLVQIFKALCTTQNYRAEDDRRAVVRTMIQTIGMLRNRDEAAAAQFASRMENLLADENCETDTSSSVFHVFCSRGLESLCQNVKTDHVRRSRCRAVPLCGCHCGARQRTRRFRLRRLSRFAFPERNTCL